MTGRPRLRAAVSRRVCTACGQLVRPFRTVARTTATFGALGMVMAGAASALAPLAPAQMVASQGTERARSATGAGERPLRQPPARQQPPDRLVEQRVQERIARMMRDRLQLTDQQMLRLRDVNDRLGPERAAVREQERELRMALRSELLAGAEASEERVADLLARLPEVERRRIALQEREQQALAEFLTPVQRARYIALQEEIRRGLEQIQQRRGRPGPPAANRPPLEQPPSDPPAPADAS